MRSKPSKEIEDNASQFQDFLTYLCASATSERDKGEQFELASGISCDSHQSMISAMSGYGETGLISNSTALLSKIPVLI